MKQLFQLMTPEISLGFSVQDFLPCVLDTSNMSSWKLLVTEGRNSERKGTASCRASGNKG